MADLVPTQPDETNYEAKQQAHSAEYRKEWDRAPESIREPMFDEITENMLKEYFTGILIEVAGSLKIKGH